MAHLTGLRLLNLTWVPSVSPLTFLAPLRALTALSLAFTFASEAHLRRRARLCMHVWRSSIHVILLFLGRRSCPEPA